VRSRLDGIPVVEKVVLCERVSDRLVEYQNAMRYLLLGLQCQRSVCEESKSTCPALCTCAAHVWAPPTS
jgi:hypothetical protein